MKKANLNERQGRKANRSKANARTAGLPKEKTK
jgi:hypothetical protein